MPPTSYIACVDLWYAPYLPDTSYINNAEFGYQSVVAIYRLAVMHNQTTSLTSLVPSSLNTPAAKATFYVFHMLPEWISVALLFGFNIREMFDTGLWGNWRNADETECQKERRIARAAKKRAIA